MNCFVLCNVGFESVVSKELSSFGCKNLKPNKGFILFDVSLAEQVLLCPDKQSLSRVSFEKLFELYYCGRSFTKLVLLLDEFSFASFDDLINKICSVDVKDWIVDGFGVDCSRVGDHAFTSFDVKQSVSNVLSKKYSFKVNYKSDFQFFVLVKDGSCFFGVDFCAVDLGKRDYRIFLHGQNLKGSEAFCLLSYAGIKNDVVLLDPLCRTGIIPIEASLFLSNKSPNFFDKDKFSFVDHSHFKDFDFDSFFDNLDKNIVEFSQVEQVQLCPEKPRFSRAAKIFAVDTSFPNVQAAKKNSKIAGVESLIDFSRKDIDDLDLKFDKNSIDLIVTFPDRKLTDLFFKRCSIILNPEGKLLLVSKDKVLSSSYFKIEESFSFFQGKDELFVYMWKTVMK